MLTLANLPALLLVLNIAAAPADGESRETASARDVAETTNVGFARLRINRDVRFIIDDDRAVRKIESLQRAGRPDSAHGLPRFLGREPGRTIIRFQSLVDTEG